MKTSATAPLTKLDRFAAQCLDRFIAPDLLQKGRKSEIWDARAMAFSALIIVSTGPLGVLLYGATVQAYRSALVIATSSTAAGLGLFFLRRPSGRALSRNWITTCLWLGMTALAYVNGGFEAPTVKWLVVLPLIGFYFAGWKWVLTWMSISLASLGLLAGLEWLKYPFIQEIPAHQFLWIDWVSTTVLAMMMTALTLINHVLRRQSDIDLQAHQAQKRTVLDMAVDGVFIVDEQRRLTTVNRSGAQFLGGQADQLLGRPLQEAAPQLDGLIKESIAEKSESAQQAVRLLEVDRLGEPSRWLEVSWARSPRVEEAYTVLIARDVSERVEAQKQIEQVRDAALAASQAKSQFVANMSHELRTPLNTIIGYTEMVMEELSEEDVDTQFLTDLDRVLNASDYLLALIDNVLDLSKIEAGRVELDLEDFDLDEMLAQIEQAMKPFAQPHENTFKLVNHSSVHILRGDATKIQQILFNLLSNAFKFTRHGRITLSCSDHPTRNQVLCFEVNDTGIGMTEDEMARVFGEFEQADASTTRHYGGTGLGLAISQRLTTLMNGNLQVRSKAGEGTSFTFCLPYQATQSQQLSPLRRQLRNSSPLKLAETPDLRGLDLTPTAGFTLLGSSTSDLHRQKEGRTQTTVLIIEDDPGVRRVIQRTLEHDGHRILEASSGKQGLELCRAIKPDVIVLDPIMPDLDGWSILTQIKSQKATRDIPVIFTSILDSQQTGFALEIQAYAVKPLDRADIQNALRPFHDHRPNDIALVIDDERQVRDWIADQLKQQNWAVVEAANAMEALEHLDRVHPRLILLDLVMPEMSGLEFLAVLRHWPERRDIPVMLISEVLTPSEHQNLLAATRTAIEKGNRTSHRILEEVRRFVAHVRVPTDQASNS